MLDRIWRRAFVACLFLGFVLASSCVPDPSRCTSEADCLASRVCKDGTCVCSPGRTACPSPTDAKAGEACVDLAEDKAHCGACGAACQAGHLCQKGACRKACEAPTPLLCGSACVDPRSDALHCGACDRLCSQASICKDGACLCAGGFLECRGRCIDPLVTKDHCGACDSPCASGLFCAQGQCVQACPALTPDVCLGGCVDTKQDPRHCGGCGQACAAGKVCFQGQCQCPEGESLCAGVCLSTPTDRQNCGLCGVACATGQVCADGLCVEACPAKTPEPCLGGCFDTKASTQHCGACGKPCKPSEICKDGGCRCPDGFVTCNDLCVDLQANARHCGACGKICPPGMVCVEGRCEASCPAKTPAACGGGCYDLQTSTLHCGLCARRCPDGYRCDQGQCTRLCPPDEVLCQGRCVVPSQTKETCNGLDDNCDGSIDEDLEQACYSGPSATKDIGLCRGGRQQCLQGRWGACLGESLPTAEICGDGKDNNCDGSIDEGCSCKAGESRPCYDGPLATKDIGECKSGVQVCDKGEWGSCVGSWKPLSEICDGKDNDCDGHVDEAFPGSSSICQVTSQQGECRQGRLRCHEAALLCEATQTPQAEVCDGKDNDCNGQIDDAIGARSCYSGPQGTSGQGACRLGSQGCKNGLWEPCQGEIVPQAETCDGQDNDCDGRIDEGTAGSPLERPFFPGIVGCTIAPTGQATCQGSCKAGVERCLQGRWSVSLPPILPQAEVCDGQDNDCDGLVDKGLTDRPLCPNQQGSCRGAKATDARCVGGLWTACQEADYQASFAAYQAQETRCDGQDNDCDGKIDEDAIPCVFDIAGTGFQGYSNGLALESQIDSATGLARDAAGNLYFSEHSSHRIRKLGTDGRISLVAGGQSPGFRDGAAAAALFYFPGKLLLDPSGDLLVADQNNHRIRKIHLATGQVTTLAGSSRGYKDGPALQAQFYSPSDLVFDPQGNLYITDFDGFIRKLDPSGQVTTFLGHLYGTFGGYGGYGPTGPASLLSMLGPTSLWFDSAGSLWYAENLALRVYQGGAVHTLAAPSAGFADGDLAQARWKKLAFFATGKGGEIVFADTENHRIRKISPQGLVTTLAGDGQIGYSIAPPLQAKLSFPRGLAVDPDGDIFFLDSENFRIRKIALSKKDTCTPEGATRPCFSTQATAPLGLCKAGTQTCLQGRWSPCTGEILPTLEICDGLDNDCDGKVDEAALPVYCEKQAGVCYLSKKACIGGSPRSCGASDYQLHSAKYASTDTTCDYSDNDCNGRQDDQTTSCSIVWYGNGVPDVRTTLKGIAGLALDPQGNLYIAGGSTDPRIRKLDPQGVLSEVAGQTTPGYRDGPAAQALFRAPRDLLFAPSGDLYIVDRDDHRIRKLNAQGQVTTVAGDGTCPYNAQTRTYDCHKDGPALQARFRHPSAITQDAAGNLYIADTSNHRIRKLDTSGQVTTIAGDGLCLFSGSPPKADADCYRDGPAAQAQFFLPAGIAMSPTGDLWISDTMNHRLRKLDTAGQVTTIGGTGSCWRDQGIAYASCSCSGPLSTISLCEPTGLFFHPNGLLYLLETRGRSVREITPTLQIKNVLGPGDTLSGPPRQVGPFDSAKVVVWQKTLYTYSGSSTMAIYRMQMP